MCNSHNKVLFLQCTCTGIACVCDSDVHVLDECRLTGVTQSQK